MPKKITILIIEDERVMADMYAHKLKKSGYNVITAFDGQDGITMAKAQKPDYIFLDILLPKKNGFEVLEVLRADMALQVTPIYMFSNLTQEEDRRQAKKLGATGFIVKAEYTPRQFVEYIEGLRARTCLPAGRVRR